MRGRPLTPDAQRVINQIRAAFAGVKLGNGVGLRQGRGLDDYADAATLAKYRAQDEQHDWQRISSIDLCNYAGSLSFFDPEGMRFHLPAFLIADIEGLLDKDLIFHLSSTCGSERLSKLTPAQRAAVREYLLFCLDDEDFEFVHEMITTSLAEYWTESGEG